MTEEIDYTQDKDVHIIEDNGRTIYLIGTAHISHHSASLVKNLIEQLKPDSVAIELCQQRYDSIKDANKWKNLDIIKVIKDKKTGILIVNLALSSFQKKAADKMNIKPGMEMLTAMDVCEEQNANLELIDRNIKTTLARTVSNVSFFKKMEMMMELVFSAFGSSKDLGEKEIEALKEKDALEIALKEWEGKAPKIKESLIDERDLYMVKKLRESKGKTVVAVVGAGHVPGMKKNWDTEINLAELDEVPKNRKIFSTLIKWILSILLIGLIAYGFKNGYDKGLENVWTWIFYNGILAAIGAVLARGHILTIIAAFVLAPICSLIPFIGTGMVAALIEAKLRRPKVDDFEKLPYDVSSIKGWYSNKVTRILLVLIFCSLGSLLGSLLGVLNFNFGS